MGLFQCSISIVALVIWLPESPKWLYGQKRYKECHQVLKQMAKTNNKTLVKANNLILYTEAVPTIEN